MFAAACFNVNDLQGDFLDGYPKCKALMEHVFNLEGEGLPGHCAVRVLQAQK